MFRVGIADGLRLGIDGGIDLGIDLECLDGCLGDERQVDKLAPSRFLKSSLTLARMRDIAVRSTSTVAVSWAATCRDSTIRLAIVWRSLDIFSVVPRSELTSAAADAAAGVGPRRRSLRCRGPPPP